MHQLRPPGAVLDITRDLEAAGFEAWCVGGAVRDALLGLTHLDWDLATNATPDQVRTVFGRKRTIPVGIEFGTVGVLDPAGVMHEITTFRRDVRTDGRHAEVEFGASLDEDLARRDFTVNAIAYSPSRKEIRDPFEGRRDLELGRLRAVGDARQRMREDRLRALRALRFASRFGFEIDADTWAAIGESAPFLTRLSAERVKQELEKTMDQVEHPSKALNLWRRSGALSVLIPSLGDVRDDVIAALDFAALPESAKRPGRRLTRLAVLFSDVEPATALRTVAGLRFSKHEAQWISTLARLWQTTGATIAEALSAGEPSAGQVRRWVAAIGRTNLPAFFRLAEARWAALRLVNAPAPAAQAVHGLYRRCLRAALSEPIDLGDLAVDGDDLRRAGIDPGPVLGKILVGLLDQVLENPGINTPDELVRRAQAMRGSL
jgi:tRNA nucleotidyltransferase (CCA-adding enzyme)